MKNNNFHSFKIIAFPKSKIPYNVSLYEAISKKNITVIEGIFSGRWLLSNLNKGDIAHIHWPSFFYNGDNAKIITIVNFIRFIFLLLLIRLKGAAIVWTAHNLYPHDRCKIPQLDFVARKFVILLSKKIFVHGKSAANLLAIEFGNFNNKLLTIDHGNWLQLYKNSTTRQQARQYLNLDENCFVYLFAGLCKPYKNLSGLIKQYLALKDTDSILLIAGAFQDEKYEMHIKSLAGSKNNSTISITSKFIPDDEFQYYLNACDVVVLPYLETLTSGAAILALSFGRPVVAPDKGYLSDIIDQNRGILYDINSKNGLLSALKEVRLKEFDSKAILDFARTLSWDTIATKIVNSLCEI